MLLADTTQLARKRMTFGRLTEFLAFCRAQLTQEVCGCQDSQRCGDTGGQEELSKAKGPHNGTSLACKYKYHASEI